jgi:NAD(P)-dependent dehydrogenase (short-subunit alcohol dehydrogenase family)
MVAGVLQNRVALVTGSASGIGAALVERLSEEGARVAGLDIQPTKARAALSLEADVADEAAIEAAVERIETEIGPLEILVNCAGIIGPLDGLVNVSPADWERTQRVNVTGTFITNTAVLRRMIPRQRGRIVNIASSAAVGLPPGQGPYNISKATVIALTKQLAQEVYADGIRVNCIDPGAVLTAIVDDVLDRDTETASAYTREFQEHIRAYRDAGHMHGPDEVLDLIVFLVSDASGLIAGQFIRNSSKTEACFEQ